MRFPMIAAFLAIMFAPMFAVAQAQQQLSAEQKQAVEKMIAEYFINNPEALGQALDNMQTHYQRKAEEQRKQAVRDNASDLYASADDFSMGPADAPITIVEFFDYNCGYCKRAFAPLMEVMQETDDVRLVFKELPILSPASRQAAQTALAMEDKLKFLTFHTKLMTHEGQVNEALISKTLNELHLPASRINKLAQSEKIQKIISRNERLAETLGISGTPAFIINDTLYPGALAKDELLKAINTARAALIR